ncbi:hypothetical protein ACIGO8_08120 [Streptomyces sp. NPDC053493]|uniref:hypothetical protein n=1 Tax=Streptomyces sp. NPDC053493 TaxID=3365705 RepID=UPI0037D48D71
MAHTDKELAQIATGAARAAGMDAGRTRDLLRAAGLTDAELQRALFYLESNRPLLGR